MSGMPWIKIDTEILDDPKMAKLDDSVKWRFIQLILLAGKCDAEGFIVMGDTPLSEGDIAFCLRINEDILSEDLKVLSSNKLIEFDDEVLSWLIINFSKRQGRSQTEKRKQWSERQRKHREKIQTQESDIEEEKETPGNVTGDYTNVTGDEKRDSEIVTPPEERRVEEIREDKRREEEEEEAAPSASSYSRIAPDKILCDASGLSYFPADQSEWVEVIIRLAEDHGIEDTTSAMKKAFEKWVGTKSQNGRPYRRTNLGWINWAQEELAGGEMPSQGKKKLTTEEEIEKFKREKME